MDKSSEGVARIPRWILPSQRGGYALLAVAVLLCILNYARRSDYEEFVKREGLGFGFLVLALAPIIVLALIALGAFVVVTVSYAFRKKGHPLPIIVLIVGGILSETAALPPSPAATAFYQHRSDYEALVEMARQHNLVHDGICQGAYSPPAKYRLLTRDCVFVETRRGLAVSFEPPSSAYVIAYAENLEALRTLIYCDGRHGIMKSQLDSSWYVCSPAQD